MTYGSCRFLFHQFIQRDKAYEVITDTDAQQVTWRINTFLHLCSTRRILLLNCEHLFCRLPHSRVGGRLTMPKYSIRLGGNSAVKMDEWKWNDRRFFVSVQNIFALTFRTDDREIRGDVFRNIFQRNQFRFIFRFPADSKRDVLCRAVWIRTIEWRKSKTIFCDGGFQFPSVSSTINAYDTSLSRRPGSVTRPR